ncbi:hypothetical protein L083_4004 [Actinoplanes sp. N902-109]|nr:hypothetical protein L083_4004 [Actinoplanes sp. N902-109]
MAVGKRHEPLLQAEGRQATSPSVTPGRALQSRLPPRSFCLRGSGEDLPLRRHRSARRRSG